MASMAICRYRGFGNDYLILDTKETQGCLRRKLKMLCQSDLCEGISKIICGPSFSAGTISAAVYQPDGIESIGGADSALLFATYLKDAGYIGENTIMLTVGGQEIEVEIQKDGNCIRQKMGRAKSVRPSLEACGLRNEICNESLLFHGSLYNVTCLSAEASNCLLMAEDVSKSRERFSLPGKLHLQLFEVVDRGTLKARLHRPAQTGISVCSVCACAAASAAWCMGISDRHVKVELPCGELSVEVAKDQTVYLTGAAEKVGELEFL